MSEDTTAAGTLFENATQADIDWVAAMFEGEGTVSARLGQATAYRVQVEIQMTDEDVLEDICLFVGAGKVKGPYLYERFGKTKPTFTWGLYNWDHVEDFYESVKHRLKSRRTAQWAEVLSHATPLEDRGRGAARRNQTHCKRGHEFTPENTHIDPKTGARSCVTCNRARHRELKAAERAHITITHLSSHTRWHVNRGIVHPNCLYCGTAHSERAQPLLVKDLFAHTRWHVNRDLVHENCVHCGTAQLDELEA